MMENKKHRHITIDLIKSATAAYYGCTAEQLKPSDRTKRAIMTRWVAIALCSKMTRQPIQKIAKSFPIDQRNAEHARIEISDMERHDRSFAAELDAIRANISAIANGADVTSLPTHPLIAVRKAVGMMTKADRRSYVGIAITRLAEGKSVDEVVSATGLARQRVETILADPVTALHDRRRSAVRYRRPEPMTDDYAEPFDFEAFAARGGIRIVPSDARVRPAEIVAPKRIRAANVTASILGDPIPGRSALDRKEASDVR